MTLEEKIKDICSEFDFWYTFLTKKGEATTLGVPYKNTTYVYVDKIKEGLFTLVIHNNEHDASVYANRLQMPVTNENDLIKAFAFFDMTDVVNYIKGLPC